MVTTTPGLLFLDFVHPELCKISCDKPSSDGYEATNLISADPRIKRNGFLSERFISPPVTVTLKFVCSIDVSHVIVQTNVGTHKTLNLELLAKIGDSDFHLLAKASDHSPTQNLVYFTNHNFGRRPERIQVPAGALTRHIGPNRNIGQLQFKLTHTRNGHVPALGRVEVWGRPTRGVPYPVRKVINFIQLQQDATEKINTSSTLGNTTPEKDVPQLPDDVPSEFIDTISCDIMTLPMLLPSGHNVDQQTLEKYEKFEAANARLPNDPFTGLPFNPRRKPLPNSILKSRIDAYLLSRPDVAKGVGHTVGRGQSNSVCSSLLGLSNFTTVVSPVSSTEKNSVLPLPSGKPADDVLQKSAKDDAANNHDSSGSVSSDLVVIPSAIANSHTIVQPLMMQSPVNSEKVGRSFFNSGKSSFISSSVLRRSTSLTMDYCSTKSKSNVVDVPSTAMVTTYKTQLGIMPCKPVVNSTKTHSQSSTDSEVVIISEKQIGNSSQLCVNKAMSDECFEVNSDSDDDVICVRSTSLQATTQPSSKRRCLLKSHTSVNTSEPPNKLFKTNKEVIITSSQNSRKCQQKLSAGDTSCHPLTHEQNLKNSLDLAMKSILGPLTSYTDFTSQKNSNSVSDGCSCSVPCSVMYQLPCSHRICRKCLLQKCNNLNQIVCVRCGCLFNNDQPVRIHI